VATLNHHFGEESPLPREGDDAQAHAKVAVWLRATLDAWWHSC
jgi:hypothetical protein